MNNKENFTLGHVCIGDIDSRLFLELAREVYPKAVNLQEWYDKYNYECLVAYDNKEIIAIAIFVETMRGHCEYEIAFVDMIAVLPSCRGNGIAKQMLDRLKDSYSYVVLECPVMSESNAFYEKISAKKRAFAYKY